MPDSAQKSEMKCKNCGGQRFRFAASYFFVYNSEKGFAMFDMDAPDEVDALAGVKCVSCGAEHELAYGEEDEFSVERITEAWQELQATQ